MAISAVNCAPGEIQVYDNLYRTVSKDVKELVVSMIHTYKTALRLTTPPMVMHMFVPILMSYYLNLIDDSWIY